jgi:GGDEF domain-containing protein
MLQKIAKSPTLPQLIAPDTGLLTYPAFLFVLEREYFRSRRARRPLAIWLLSYEPRGQAFQDPKTILAHLLPMILRVKRNSDILAHYENNQLALLLPNAMVTGAKIAARRVLRSLETTTNSVVQSLDFAFGIADVIKDGNTLSTVLHAAQEAQRFAKESGSKLFAYRDLAISLPPDERNKLYERHTLASLSQTIHAPIVQGLMQEIISKDSGVFVSPVCNFFLERDYKRALRESEALSVLIFKLAMTAASRPGAEVPYNSLKREVLQYITRIKRKADILTEYDDQHFALLLPDTTLLGAKALAKRIKAVIDRELSFVLDRSVQITVTLLAADALNNYPNLSFREV